METWPCKIEGKKIKLFRMLCNEIVMQVTVDFGVIMCWFKFPFHFPLWLLLALIPHLFLHCFFQICFEFTCPCHINFIVSHFNLIQFQKIKIQIDQTLLHPCESHFWFLWVPPFPNDLRLDLHSLFIVPSLYRSLPHIIPESSKSNLYFHGSF